MGAVAHLHHQRAHHQPYREISSVPDPRHAARRGGDDVTDAHFNHLSNPQLYLFTGVLGMGLGLVMQVLVLAVQNSVSADQYGVATSGVTLFRSIGGAIGVALFGAVFTHILQSGLIDRLPEGAELPRELNPVAIHHLPDALRLDYLDAFGSAIHAVFMLAAGIMVLAFVLSWFCAKRRCVGRREVSGSACARTTVA